MTCWAGRIDSVSASTCKRSQAARIANAPRLAEFAREAGIRLDAGLADGLNDGFGKDAFGEDRFDCVVGVLGTTTVVQGAGAHGSHVTGQQSALTFFTLHGLHGWQSGS